MISTCWAWLSCFLVGALCVDLESIGKLHHKNLRQPSLNIYNGRKTSVAKYPYIASVVVNGDEYGAAVILNNNYLLTTGYTVAWYSLKSLQFRVGSSYYDQQGQTVKASKVIAHPNYTGTWDWDIAVVKTDKPIKLGRNVKPVKLGTKQLKGGVKAMVAGWGEYDSTENPSEILREAPVTVYDWEKCQGIYKNDLTTRLVCTFDKKVSPCMNDFGDPLVVRGVLYGLFAGGYGCEPHQNPVLYTDVPSFYTWIQSAINNEEDKEKL